MRKPKVPKKLKKKKLNCVCNEKIELGVTGNFELLITECPGCGKYVRFTPDQYNNLMDA